MQEIWVWSLDQEEPWRRKWQPTPVYSCLGNPMDKGAWWATVHGVIMSWTQLNNYISVFAFDSFLPFQILWSSLPLWICQKENKKQTHTKKTNLITGHLKGKIVFVNQIWRIGAFELWCWRRLLRIPWTARRSSQSIVKEISPGCSLEGMILKLKLQYFGYLMRRVN